MKNKDLQSPSMAIDGPDSMWYATKSLTEMLADYQAVMDSLITAPPKEIPELYSKRAKILAAYRKAYFEKYGERSIL